MSHTETYVAKLRREDELKTTRLNVMEVAERIGCPVAEVYRLVASGHLERLTPPGRIKGITITAWAVESYLAKERLRELILKNTYLRLDALAMMLCCSKHTIYRLIKDGRLDLAPTRPNRPKTKAVTAWSAEKFVSSITGRRVIA